MQQQDQARKYFHGLNRLYGRLFLVLVRPTPFKTATDLNLDEEEKNTLMQWTLSSTPKQKENDHH